MIRPRILVTGFSAFPGARRNPTETLVDALNIARLAKRFDIDLTTAILPTEYIAVGEILPRLWNDIRPDAAIHFGLHGRAGRVRIETRAANYTRPLPPDAARQHAKGITIEPAGPAHRRVTLSAIRAKAALQRVGITASLSSDAGGYLCNYACYLSLKLAEGRGLAGFVHLPWPAEERAPRAPGGRPNWRQLARAVETVIAESVLAVRNR